MAFDLGPFQFFIAWYFAHKMQGLMLLPCAFIEV
jgi:hypothetical protein